MSASIRKEWSAEDDRSLHALLRRPDMGPQEIAAVLKRDMGDVLARIAYLTGQFGAQTS